MSVLKTATPTPNAPTDASHQATALPGSRPARSRHAASTAMTAQPSTTMLVYRLNVAASSATKPASPAQVLRLALAPAASTIHSRAPVPAAISEASVKVGM